MRLKSPIQVKLSLTTQSGLSMTVRKKHFENTVGKGEKTLRKKHFENIVGKGEKPTFSPFPAMFSTHSKTDFNFSMKFIVSSANRFNLDPSKILELDDELNHYPWQQI